MTRERNRNPFPGTTWRGRSWYYNVRIDGKQVWRGGYRTQREAFEAKTEALAKRNRGLLTRPERVTLDEYVREVWLPSLKSRGLKPTTISSYAEKAQKLARILGSKQVQALRPMHVEQMQQSLLKEGLSPRSVQYVTVVLSMVLKHAWHVGGIIQANPCERVPKPRISRREKKTLSPSQMKSILDETQGTSWEAFYRLAFFTGARRGELLALRWSDVDMEKGVLTIRSNIVEVDGRRVETSTKSGNPRKVTLDAATVAVLRNCRKAQISRQLELGEAWEGREEFITTKPDGSNVKPSSATQHWNRMCRRLGILEVRLHDSRHTHATLLLAAGEPLHVVADRLGHRDAMVTSTVYAHVLADQADRAADTFSRVAGLD